MAPTWGGLSPLQGLQGEGDNRTFWPAVTLTDRFS